MTIALYLVESTGILTELDRVKLSGNLSGKGGAISWAGNSLAIITGELYQLWWSKQGLNSCLDEKYFILKRLSKDLHC